MCVFVYPCASVSAHVFFCVCSPLPTPWMRVSACFYMSTGKAISGLINSLMQDLYCVPVLMTLSVEALQRTC